MGDSLPSTHLNHGAKFDAASFILGGEIRNRTNTHTNKRKTVNDISTPCLSACVDNQPSKSSFEVAPTALVTHFSSIVNFDLWLDIDCVKFSQLAICLSQIRFV